MSTFICNAIRSALVEAENIRCSLDFSGKSWKLDSAEDAGLIINAINSCTNLKILTLTGNTIGVAAAKAIGKAVANKHELVEARFSDMFTGRMKTEIPLALTALGDGMIEASARLRVLDLSDNAFGPIGVQGLAKLLQSNVCAELQELRLNNNGLGITGGTLLALALSQIKLTTFVAGRNRLENEGATALAKVFKGMGTLEELTMPQNGIYHVGISALADALKNNPALTTLNLNDNTIGEKGAISIAKTLPRLKDLRCINFGDCLLKSKGSRVLATAFRYYSVPIEFIDMSYNEIGLKACMELVEALTTLPDSGERLRHVELTGNRLGGVTNRYIMKQILGDCAVLSDGEESYGEGSDVERYDSEGTDGEGTDGEGTDGEGTDGEGTDGEGTDGEGTDGEGTDGEGTDGEGTDGEGSDGEGTDGEGTDGEGTDDVYGENITGVAIFLKYPTFVNLYNLGSAPDDVIDAYLESIKNSEEFVKEYVEILLLVSAVSPVSPVAAVLYSRLAERVASRFVVEWTLADAMLRGLALIKSEVKQPFRWGLPECYVTLAANITANTFSASLRCTLRLFFNNKLSSFPKNIQDIIKAHPTLLSD